MRCFTLTDTVRAIDYFIGIYNSYKTIYFIKRLSRILGRNSLRTTDVENPRNHCEVNSVGLVRQIRMFLGLIDTPKCPHSNGML